MEATLIRIGSRLHRSDAPVGPAAPEQTIRSIDGRTYEFLCRWAGDASVLQDLITARVDWGPFDITCTPEARITGHCRCEVRYNGPMREQPQLMTSFWGLLADFPPFAHATAS